MSDETKAKGRTAVDLGPEERKRYLDGMATKSPPNVDRRRRCLCFLDAEGKRVDMLSDRAVSQCEAIAAHVEWDRDTKLQWFACAKHVDKDHFNSITIEEFFERVDAGVAAETLIKADPL